MNEHEPLDERPYPGQHVEPVADVYDDEMSLQPWLQSIWLYRRVIGGVVTGVMVAFVVAALVASAIAPVEQIGSVSFRLLFDGASDGMYPNETPFSSAEITSTPVLTEVFDANELGRFISYEEFQYSIVVLQSNPEIDLLSFEYQTKLVDTRLTPVDRARIEDEFRAKRESLTDPRFTLNWRRGWQTVRMPPSLVSKVLDDTLSTWARQAQEQKGALLYNISVLSTNILRRNLIDDEEFLTAIDILRTQVMRIIESIDGVGILPGAGLVRTDSDRISLAEIRLKLEDILRFELGPLLGMIRMDGLSKDPEAMASYVNNQLFQIRLEYEEAQKRVQAVQESLRAYMIRKGAVTGSQQGSGSRGATLGLGSVEQGLIPQLGESFLDRLVEMSTMNSDVEYRQRLTDLVIEESFTMAALEREQGYYEEARLTLRDSERSSGEVGQESEILRIKSRLERTFAGVVVVVEQLGALYEKLSAHNLNPRTLLYTITTPVMMRTERGLELGAIGLYGILVFTLSLFLVPLGCLVHSYFQREIVHQDIEDQPAGSTLGGQSEEQREEKPADRSGSV